MMRAVHARTVVCAALLVILGACSSPANSSNAEPSTSESSSATPKAAVESSKAVSFSRNYSYPDGITVAITGIAHGQLGLFPTTDDPNAKEGDPYTVLSVTVHNQAAKSHEMSIVGTLRYGKDKTAAYRLWVEDDAIRTLAPGETSDPYDMGFLLPVEAREDVDLELYVDAGQHGPAQFTGSISKARS
jgi:hypothetical protein